MMGSGIFLLPSSLAGIGSISIISWIISTCGALAMGNKVREILRERVRGAVSILLVVLLCGVVDGFSRSAGGSPAVTNYLPMWLAW